VSHAIPYFSYFIQFIFRIVSGHCTNICFSNYSLLGMRISVEKQLLVCNMNRNINMQKLKVFFFPLQDIIGVKKIF